MDSGLDRWNFWADLEGDGPGKTLWVTGLVIGQEKGEAQGWRVYNALDSTPSDVCLFLKNVIHMCIIYIINTDTYLFFPKGS